MISKNTGHPTLYLSRRETLKLIGLGLLAPGVLAGCSHNSTPVYRSTSYEATIADARVEIGKAIATQGGPNAVSIALVDDQRVIWAEAFGFLNKKTGKTPTTATIFGLASGSKVFAAIAVMILVDRGLVALDAPLVRYVKNFRMADSRYDQITLRMLLSHSSGLPGSDYRNGSTFAPVAGHVNQTLAALAGQRLKHAPGEMAVYCNDGFDLIELVVTAVTGASYTDFVAREILTPLGMMQSRFAIETLPPGSYAATLNANGEPNPQEYINVLATGGIYSTPSDMGRLAMMMLNNGRLEELRLLSPGAVAEMGRDQSATLPLNPLHLNNFGLSWDNVRQPGLAAVGVTAWDKSGGSTYFHTQFDVAPVERLAVMIMGAGGVLDVGTLAERVMLHALAERGSIVKVPEPLISNPPAIIPASEAELVGMTGGYAGENLFRLEEHDQSLTLSGFDGRQWFDLIPGLTQRVGGNWIAASVPDALFIVEADGLRHLAQRAPSGLKHYESAGIRGQALSPLPPLSAAWQARVGKSWVKVNDPYSAELALGMDKPLFKLFLDPGLPGYLITSTGKAVDPSVSDERALWCGKVAARDLADVVIQKRDGMEWVLLNSTLYRPLDSVPALAAGQTVIVSDAEGLGEWRQLPAAAALTITAANAWYLYDTNFNLLNAVIKGQTITLDWGGNVPAGAYLLVHGDPTTAITVTVTA